MNLYRQRREINRFEILGIEKYISSFFYSQEFIFSENAVNFEFNEKYFCAFLINKHDIFIMESIDDAENRFFSYNYIEDNLNLIDNKCNILLENIEIDFFLEDEINYINNWRNNLTEEQIKNI